MQSILLRLEAGSVDLQLEILMDQMQLLLLKKVEAQSFIMLFKQGEELSMLGLMGCQELGSLQLIRRVEVTKLRGDGCRLGSDIVVRLLMSEDLSPRWPRFFAASVAASWAAMLLASAAS